MDGCCAARPRVQLNGSAMRYRSRAAELAEAAACCLCSTIGLAVRLFVKARAAEVVGAAIAEPTHASQVASPNAQLDAATRARRTLSARLRVHVFVALATFARIRACRELAQATLGLAGRGARVVAAIRCTCGAAIGPADGPTPTSERNKCHRPHSPGSSNEEP